jgi:pimeloyl-ACP methyl ester carboxylesterase
MADRPARTRHQVRSGWWATVTGMGTTSEPDAPARDRCTTPDGLGIEIYDFGGRGLRDLVLVHATGFCALALAPLAHALGGEYHCWALDLRAHGRSDRPADGIFDWSGFALDVAAVIDHLGLDRPAGFGHSCGGAAVLLAEEAAPSTFRSLYCFEPVIMPGPPAGMLVDPSVADDNPLSVAARRRRDTFPSSELAFANFSSKPSFAAFDPEALMGYIDGGFALVPAEEGGDGRTIRLRCHRDDEAAIYAKGFFHGAFDHLTDVQCPVTLSCGETTDSFGLASLERNAERLPRSRVEILPGIGHFGPFEQPALVAGSVRRSLGTDRGTPRS